MSLPIIKSILILTGTGISAESGIDTFRSAGGIWDALAACDLFVSIGTSGHIYPAAQFVQQASRSGAQTLELSLEPSAGAHDFAAARHGAASTLVPAWVDEILTRKS